MTKRPSVHTDIAKLEALTEQVADLAGLELVEVELKGAGRAQLLRVYIDKPEGVTHADCETVSRNLGAELDKSALLPDSYTLEVSSPGVERRLSKPRDFERFQGHKAKFTLKQPVADRSHWEGTIAGFAGGTITLEAGEGHTVQFHLDQVDKANLKFEWK